MSDNTTLSGKVAVITGAGGGIGREVALHMAGLGAAIVVNDIGASLSGADGGINPAQDLVAEIERRGGQAVVNHDSVAEPGAGERIIDASIAAFGRIDCVVNNAGILRDAIFHKMEPASWQAVLAVHLQGAFEVSRAAAPHFRAQGSGSFIHFTSTAALIGNTAQANYAAAKLGMVGLSRGIAIDMQRFGVRSNCVAPTAWTRMISSIPTETDAAKAWIDKLKQMGPEKIAPLVAYLASDASRDVSGQIFGVRKDEIFLFSQPRPVRSIHRDGGWSLEDIAGNGMPALRKHFTPMDTAGSYFDWDPL
ncbi:SDR family oxidoreductase [Xanthobacteraceae bacterium A53D]